MIRAEAKAEAARTAKALRRALIAFGGAVLIEGLAVWTVTRAGGLALDCLVRLRKRLHAVRSRICGALKGVLEIVV